MSRSTLTLSRVLLFLFLLAAPRAPAQAPAVPVGGSEGPATERPETDPAVVERERPLIERSVPDASRRALVERWQLEFERQRPVLATAFGELEQEHRWWPGSTGRRRCARAEAALGRVDRTALFAGADYRLVSAVGRALDHLAAAVRACYSRRYFELDYRLGLAMREFDRLARLTAPAP